ncbi:MAG: hypothetical protein ACI96N_001838, partial [Arenicella sp.]
MTDPSRLIQQYYLITLKALKASRKLLRPLTA